MNKFAKVESNNLISSIVIAVSTDDIPDSNSNTWIQVTDTTSEPFIGGIFDSANQIFLKSKVFDSWVYNYEKHIWEPPIPYPDYTQYYNWEESNTSWVLDTNKFVDNSLQIISMLIPDVFNSNSNTTNTTITNINDVIQSITTQNSVITFMNSNTFIEITNANTYISNT